MIIEIDIVNKRPAVVGAPVIVCGNSGYTIQFTFDEEWANEALKTARFVYTKAGAVGYQDIVFGGSVVPVPVLSDVREVYVGVYAGELQTTTPARIPCERSILCGTSVEHEEPDPDVYNQILEAVNQLISATGIHPEDKNNPHGVTAEQVGATPASHATDKNNPHGVTAAQVGATPASHATDKNNPHGVTAEQVGAVSMEVLWVNASPNSEFPYQTVNLDLTLYSHVVVDCSFARDTVYSLSYLGQKNTTVLMDAADAGSDVLYMRHAAISDTGITFMRTWRNKVNDGYNSYLIPVRIYGIKGVSA